MNYDFRVFFTEFSGDQSFDELRPSAEYCDGLQFLTFVQIPVPRVYGYLSIIRYMVGVSCISKLFFDRTDGVYFTVPGFRVVMTGGEFNGTGKSVACLTIEPYCIHIC
jgi:hypothetical protein